MLGGGFTSRLVESIRVNRGLSYGVRSRFGVSRVTGLFAISSFTKNETVGELVEVALDRDGALRRVRSHRGGNLPGGELPGGSLPAVPRDHDHWADRITDAWIFGYEVAEITGYQERIRSVTREEAREATARHLPLEDGVVLAVGPAGPIEKQLSRFGPVEIWPVRRVM